jgi:ADP-heptose:LPS heptosyltransferase
MFARQEWRGPNWDGGPLTGRTILVYGEQGIGDEIMFASCLPDLLAQADRVIVAAEARLIPLFQRSFPRVNVIHRALIREPHRLESLGPIDFQIAAGSVPRYTRRRLEDFPARSHYLFAAAEACVAWEERLAGLGPGRSVGISWHGGKEPRAVRDRSVSLEGWAGLFQVPGVHFINCQYGDVAAELETARQQLGVTIHHWPEIDPLKNMDDFAALISALDLVISVDNSTVHLAGALGVPCWVALPFVPDWRWLLEREDSPWYSSVRLFRQTQRGRWDDVFEGLAAALGERVAGRSTGG